MVFGNSEKGSRNINVTTRKENMFIKFFGNIEVSMYRWSPICNVVNICFDIVEKSTETKFVFCNKMVTENIIQCSERSSGGQESKMPE